MAPSGQWRAQGTHKASSKRDRDTLLLGLLMLAIGALVVWHPWRGDSGTLPIAGGEWVAGASIFSGRPDPAWLVPAPAALELEQVWLSLPVSEDTVPLAGVLGYRGCWLRAPDGREWRAFGALVETTTGRRETRRDPGKTFERRLLQTAPLGILPPGLP